MSQDTTLMRIAAIVSTLEETNGSPESMLYIFCNMDMNAWHSLRNILIGANLISIKGNYVTLTTKGKEMATKINETLKQNAAK